MSTTNVDPLTPQAMLQDPMMSVLSLNVIAYIKVIVSQQVGLQER